MERKWLIPSVILIEIMLMINTFSTCSISRNNKQQALKIDSIAKVVGYLPSKTEVEAITERNQIQGLLWEDAIDKHQLSVAEIQVRLANNKDSILKFEASSSKKDTTR